eukprot:1149059-Pyramimonas_sp.AAC.1
MPRHRNDVHLETVARGEHGGLLNVWVCAELLDRLGPLVLGHGKLLAHLDRAGVHRDAKANDGALILGLVPCLQTTLAVSLLRYWDVA